MLEGALPLIDEGFGVVSPLGHFVSALGAPLSRVATLFLLQSPSFFLVMFCFRDVHHHVLRRAPNTNSVSTKHNFSRSDFE